MVVHSKRRRNGAAVTPFPYTREDVAPAIGLVVLQTDETIENDMRHMLGQATVHVTRVPSTPEVSRDTLAQMAAHLTGAASLLPGGAQYGAVGYGCTSGTAQIGAPEIHKLIQAGVDTPAVSEPVSALVAACGALGVRRIAFLSPYIAAVSDHLRATLREQGVETPVFGTFAEGMEEAVVRISPASTQAAAVALCAGADVDGLFLSCTNLRTLDIIAPLETALNMPVLSSNQVLGWHLARLAGQIATGPGRLFQTE